MKTYRFALILAGNSELTEELADSLFAAGCDDATLTQSGGVTRVEFDRESSSFESAVRSAMDNVRSAGLRVDRLELDAEELSALERV